MNWHTDFDAALAEAARTHKPLLSLHLLGRLDEELSCANSRFFRTTLYPRPEVGRRLRERFVLHWHSVRPVPVVRVDFGDGRRMVRTVTGNSAHFVLDARGRTADVLPGLYSAEAFCEVLDAAHALAVEVSGLSDAKRSRVLAERHRAAHARTLERWALEVGRPKERNPAVLEAATADWASLGELEPLEPTPLLARKHPTAFEAGRIALTKMRVELPILKALGPLERSIAADTARNERVLHGRVHERFASGAPTADPLSFSDWLYRDVFLMPPEDPWLGLAPDDAWSGIEGGGLTVASE